MNKRTRERLYEEVVIVDDGREILSFNRDHMVNYDRFEKREWKFFYHEEIYYVLVTSFLAQKKCFYSMKKCARPNDREAQHTIVFIPLDPNLKDNEEKRVRALKNLEKRLKD